MDHARKIGRNSNQSKLFLRDKTPINTCTSVIKEEPFEEDRRLANWKHWLADRKQRQKRLAAALNREPIDLALNAHERVRSKNETKCVMESAVKTETTNQDKYRGNPAFWKPPERLHVAKDNDDEEEMDDLIANTSRLSRNLPPILTRTGLPHYIKKEKNLITSDSNASMINLSSAWEDGDYLRKRTVELEKDIEFLEAKKPEIDSLMITGNKFKGKRKCSYVNTPVITVTTNDPKRKYLNNPDERIVLKIQNREFVLEKSYYFEKVSHEKANRLHLTKDDANDKKYVYSVFDTNQLYKILPKKMPPVMWNLLFLTQSNEISEKKFVLENKGIQTIYVDWRNTTPKIIPSPIPDRFDSCYFFNKNRISILPGQTVEIPIWFRSDRAGVKMEIWKLITEPKIFPGTLKLRLWGMSTGESWKSNENNKYKDLKKELTIRIRDLYIKEIVEDMLDEATTERRFDDVPYDMYFTERDLYEARNPQYHYNSVLVNELKTINSEIMSNAVEKEKWNLSLNDLRSIIWSIEDPDERLWKLTRFQQICIESLEPNALYTPSTYSRKKFVYRLICAFVSTFDDEMNFIKNKSLVLTIRNHDPVNFRDNENEIIVTTDKNNIAMYREIFYTRIFCSLCEIIGAISAALESHDYLNKNKIDT